ncbi:MAG: hypothetical protein IJC71_04380, partial [Clostridia bacterium]|nr:hypothetical protein [Clostridia bacterium]
MKKRTLSLILVCLMLLPAIAGCSESQVNPADNTQDTTDTSSTPTAEESAAAEGEQKLLPDIPALNFEDRTFTFLTSGVNDTNGVDWETYDIWFESMNGEVINDTVFERNLYLEDTYKVKIA